MEAYEGADSAKPTYLTEVAWSTASVAPETQARNLTTLLDVCAQTPYVAGVAWYELRDNAAAHTSYGVIDAAWQRKPSFTAFQRAGQP